MSGSIIATPSVSFGGTNICRLNARELTMLVGEVIRESKKCVFGHHNMHSLYLLSCDARMREFYERADYVHADGMWVILLAKLFGLPLRREHRVTYADWTDMLMRQANDEGWHVFYLGSEPGVSERASEVLRARHPNLNFKTEHGYFDASTGSDENRRILSRIRDYRPNLLLVGMGMPRQEHWVLDNFGEIEANAILVCGAAMDYVAGVVRTPPRWAGRIGLEWLFRLCQEPRRLWRRYLVEPWFTIRRVYSFRSAPSGRSRVSSQDQEIPGD